MQMVGKRPPKERVGILPKARSGLLAALVTTMGAAAAEPARQSASSEELQPQRYARRMTPPEGNWILESEVPPEPPKALLDIIWEFSLYPPGSEPTAQQRQAAEDLVERSYESAERNGWFDEANGRADGYAPMYDSLTHFVNEEYVLDGAALDPERPEFLMYYSTPMGTKLVGYMFLANEPLARGPQTGGPLTVWHHHVFSRDYCFLRGLIPVGEPENGECARGIALQRSPEMIHVWLLDHPAGRFASQMSIDRDALMSALERRHEERGY